MGGGVMSAAAKVAAVRIRGFTADHPFSSAIRRAASVRPAAAAAAADDLKLVASIPEAGLTRNCSEIDDWVVAGVEEEISVRDSEPMPRVVFGGAPTLNEAQEATSELSSALEKAYLSSANPTGYDGSIVEYDESGLPLANTQIIKSSELPAPAVMAFRLLHESSQAQNVVASIACDPNVWNAVLKNQELQDFLRSQSVCLSGSSMNLNVESVSDSDPLNHSFSVDDHLSNSPESVPADEHKDIFQMIKDAVVGMMTSLSDYFKNFFGGIGGNKASADGDGSKTTNDIATAGFMGLAVMAILVILLKRG